MEKTAIQSNGGISARRKWTIVSIELSVLFLWVLWVCRPYLNFNESVWPFGPEIIHSTQSHYMWEVFTRCGLCFLWNGSSNGGTPSLVELHGAPFHPLVALPAILFGGTSGTKITLLLSFFMAGVAQLWLGYVLGLKTFSRTACALLAVAGGHLAGKMSNGDVPLVLSIANCSLFIPALLQLLLWPTRKNTILLSLVTTLAFLSGQGYVQVGMLVAVLPAILLFTFSPDVAKPLVWKQLGVSVIFLLLFLAFFLIPLIHFLPNWGKDVDPEFSSAQTLGYVPLNLVIDDPDFYMSRELHKLEYPYININYIGWIPILLAATSGYFASSRQKRILSCFWVSLLLIFLAASGLTFKAFFALSIDTFQMVRYPGFIAGLAIPIILAMAGISIQSLLERRWVLQFHISDLFGKPRNWSPAVLPFLVIAGLLIALYSAYQFGTNYIRSSVTDRLNMKILSVMETDGMEWVQTVFGDNDWIPFTIRRNMKIANNNRPWHWNDRLTPQPRFLAVVNPKPDQIPISVIENIYIYEYPDVHYAWIQTLSSAIIPCTAKGQWGDIDVFCESNEAGTLFVQENYFNGWTAALDGDAAPIAPDTIISMTIPAGTHTVSFRYRPWDVLVGSLLSLIGILGAVAYILSEKRNRPVSVSDR